MKPYLKLIVILSTYLPATLLSACGEPEQKFEVQVMDETNKPMKGVEVAAWFNRKGENSPLDSYKVIGATDADGFVELQGETTWYQTSVSAESKGFYKSMKHGHWTVKRNGDRWEPWPVEVDLVMKKIRNPQPMYVAKFDNQKWLAFPEKKLGPFGFDLMEADWVFPHGKGKIADFMLEAQKENDADTGIMPKGNVVLKFSSANDGIFSVADSGGSKLQGPSAVPENQEFSREWKFENHKPATGNNKTLSNDFSDEIYIFRIRSRVDSEGNITSAHYGKIAGRIVGWLPRASPSIMMTYYLNPAPNDRGLEWDLERNLVQDTSRMRTPERP